MRIKAVAVAGLALGLLATGETGAAAHGHVPGYTTRVSVSARGGQFPTHSLAGPVSADGRLVAFSTGTADPSIRQAFIRDRVARTTALVSHTPSGDPANGSTEVVDMSADGRWLLFESTATDLVPIEPSESNWSPLLYRYDRSDRSIELVSVSDEGRRAQGYVVGGRISDDGTVVAFSTSDPTLAPGRVDHGPGPYAYVRDVNAGRTLRPAGPGRGESQVQDMTPDGRFVSFIAGEISLTGHTSYQAYRWDRRTDSIRMISAHRDGTPIARWGSDTSLSSDGRRSVLWAPTGFSSHWVKDIDTGALTPLPDGSLGMRLSADGRTVVIPAARGDRDGNLIGYDLRRKNLATGADELLGRIDGASRDYRRIFMSPDAAHVTFSSPADNVVPNDTNGRVDAFVRDIGLQHPCAGGYRLTASDGGVFAFGDARFYGSTGGMRLNQPIVASAATPRGDGYSLAAADGGVFSFGRATFHGSTGGIRLAAPITSFAPTATGRGYWLAAADGGVFAFGDARYAGSIRVPPGETTVAIAGDPTSSGYWLLTSTGAIHAFGGARRLDAPPLGGAIDIAITPSGRGAWIVSRSGAVVTAGDAKHHGSAAALTLRAPIVGIDVSDGGDGYRLLAADGGVFTYGAAHFCGSTGAITVNRPIVATT